MIGTVLGVAVAVAIAFVPVLGRTLHPLIVTSQVIPTFALAPLLVLWLGFGLEPKVIIIVIGVFFPIAVNLVEGFRSVDPGMVALMETFPCQPLADPAMGVVPCRTPVLLRLAARGDLQRARGRVRRVVRGVSRGSAS